MTTVRISRYTTWGSVRGDCGHAHQTPAAAQACADADQSGCAIQGGYRDRYVRVLSDDDDLGRYDVTRGPGEFSGEAA